MIRGLLSYTIAGLIATALKYHYSTARSDDLQWILAPTAALVNMVTQSGFVFERGVGFVSSDARFIIAPACAGLNFLIICFSMLVFTYLSRFLGFIRQVGWIVVSAFLAICVTIFVNAVRISISVASVASQPFSGFFASESLHRTEGILIYFMALSLLYCGSKAIGRRFARREEGRVRGNHTFRHLTLLVPLFWYLAVTLGIPLLRMPYHQNAPGFGEHVLFVLIVPLSFVLIHSLLIIPASTVRSKEVLEASGSAIAGHLIGRSPPSWLNHLRSKNLANTRRSQNCLTIV